MINEDGTEMNNNTTKNTDLESSRIKDIVIPIPNYQRQGHEEKCRYFVGREKEQIHLKDLLKTGGFGGAYLLVGARGMGKTTLINKVIDDLNKSKKEQSKQYEKIGISLSNENFEEIDVFRIIGKKLLNKYLEEKHPLTSWKRILLRLLPIGVLVLLAIYGFQTFFKAQELFTNPVDIKLWVAIIVYALSVLLLLGVMAEILFDRKAYLHRRHAKKLLTRIDAEVTHQSSVSGSLGPVGNASNGNFGVGKSVTEKYPIADIRFIEHELIEFLKKINHHSGLLFQKKSIPKRQFVFVFDELDKIEPTTLSETLEHKLTEDVEEIISRKKQQAVFDILGNFKYFLKNAPAKFIFIAGREMTDASMADISKRNFYLRSIFDEIIHLPSLLKEGKEYIDLRITNTIEKYVLKIIKDSNPDITFDKEIGDNKDFHKKLLKAVCLIKKETTDDRKPIVKRTAQFLRDFILFITYRSHGAPKLVVQYFEKYVKEEKGKYQLYFDYDQQLVIGFLASIYRPFILKEYNTTIGNSDKLLTTMPFLFDHILKYHNFAFSWRSLELLPEVIDVNKSPNLRTHIVNLVKYFKSSYASEIASGLFEYKFHKAMASEIQWISNISKTSRAAFNFTLDESLPLKRTFKKRIKRLEKKICEGQTTTDEEYIHSIGYYYTILGDLHFYDKEYDLALENYNQAIQPFRKRNVNVRDHKRRIRSHEFIIYVRGMLKLTLTYERMKDYDLIFTYLERINRNVYDFFHFEQEKMERLADREVGELNDFVKSELYQFGNQWVFVDGFLNALFINEKHSSQGVTYDDVLFNKQRLDRIIEVKGIEANDNLFTPNYYPSFDWYSALLKTHFLNHVGDLLFFKNGYLPKNHVDTSPKSLAQQIKDEWNIKSKKGEFFPEYFNIPVSAYQYYSDCLADLLKNWGFDDPIGDDLLKDAYQLRNRNEIRLLKKFIAFKQTKQGFFSHNYQSKLFYLVAGYLSDLANCLLCITQEHQRNESNSKLKDWLIELPSPLEDKDFSLPQSLEKDFENPILKFILFTYLSARYYSTINKQNEYAYALQKILYVIRYNFQIDSESEKERRKKGQEDSNDREENEDEENKDKLIFEKLFRKLFIPAYRAITQEPFDYTDDPQDSSKGIENAFQKVLKFERDKPSPKTKELAIVLCEIIILSKNKDLQDILVQHHWVKSYNTIQNSWSRTLELRLKVKINEKLMSDKDKKLNLIADSLWCLRKIRTNLQIYGVSYVTNYYFRAESHYKAAELLEEQELDKKKLENILRVKPDKGGYGISLNDERMKDFLNASHHYEEARTNYLNTIQLHSQGTCYYEAIGSMYYLEGDFDDQTSHFCASLDRYRINTGVIKKRLDKINHF